MEKRAAMGRVTRYSQKPKPKYLHAVTVKHSEAGQAWIWEQAARIGGPLGYKRRSPFWAITIIAFDSREKAAELESLLRRWRARCVSVTRKPPLPSMP